MKRLVLIVGILVLPVMAAPCWAIDLVEVGNAGNANDTTGYGAVSYTYYIGKYEVTNLEYCNFLNAVATTDGDTHALYNANMGSDVRGGINRSGSGTGGDPYVYTVKTVGAATFANRPVNFVGWYDAARYCNWLHNGMGGGSTETGAYTDIDGNPATHNSGATYWIPTENEWYKAAFYSGSGTDYYTYATQSDAVPWYATDDGTGNVSNAGANVANWNKGFDWNGQDGNVSIVGDCGSDSHYGTFDQGGNVLEWNEDLSNATARVRRGGNWFGGSTSLESSYRNSGSPDGEYYTVGFRVASIPEPSALLLFSPSLFLLFRHIRKRRKN